MVTNSTCKSQYIATCEAAKEATWLKNFIYDIGFVSSIKEPMETYYDIEGAYSLNKESKNHGNFRHILKKYHYVGQRVEDRDIIMNKV